MPAKTERQRRFNIKPKPKHQKSGDGYGNLNGLN